MAFNIFELSGKISADNKSANDAIDETTGKAKESGSVFSVLGSGLKIVGAGMAVAAGVAGAAAVGLSKKVVGAYAEYEQLVGGVDTLFKDASGKVQKFADDAYKTAGMSANAYMETVTGFSASLLQSLGGDTDRAADVANQAVTDMSDNANKMGSDITSIQNAYQGFAKQNYTMLDNLKLGYGGTKEEMERLLKDAQKVSGIKYDISKFADVTEAIHVMQTEMGITGTTAAEAADTISGSIDSTKAALTNLWAGLGNPKADIQKLVNDVTSSFGNVVKNITPVLNNIVTALPTLVNGIVSAIGGMLPTLLQAATSLFTQVLQTILQLLPSLIPVFVNALMTIVQTIIKNLPLLISAAVQLVTTLVQGIASALPTLIPAAVQAIVTIVQGLIDNLPLLLDAGLQLLTGLVSGIITALPTLIAALPQIITTLVNFFITSIPLLIDAYIKLLTSVVEALPTIIQAIITALPQIVDGIITALITGLPLIVNAYIQLFSAIVTALPQIIQQIVTVLPALINAIIAAIIRGLPLLINAGIQLFVALINALPQIITTIVGALPQIIHAITNALISNIGQIINAGVTLLVAIVQNLPAIMTAVAAAIPQIIAALVKALVNGVGQMASAGAKLIKGLKDSFTSINWGDVGMNIIKGIGDGIAGAAKGLLDTAANVAGDALGWMKKKLGIHSPSRVFRDEIGRWIPAGIAVGIEAEGDAIQSALDSVSTGLNFDTGLLGANIIDPAQVSTAGTSQQFGLDGAGGASESAILLRLIIAKLDEVLKTKFNIYLDKTLITREIEEGIMRGV